jgi:GTP diphosphokinase / guanosine-3',5'-bis(diphosphate) 3'-diphosphatase
VLNNEADNMASDDEHAAKAESRTSGKCNVMKKVEDYVPLIEDGIPIPERNPTVYTRKIVAGELIRIASGEPYMSHPLAVARILADMRMDVVSIETGLLHDIVEDTSVTTRTSRKLRRRSRALRRRRHQTEQDRFLLAEDRQAESYRKMLLAMVNDIRVIIVKLADRLHNMRTLGCLSPERRERIARETLEIYAPIAHRLGMGKVRGELEDLLPVSRSGSLRGNLAHHRHAARGQRRISGADAPHGGSRTAPRRHSGPRGSRVKRAYSVYQKLKRQKISLDQVYDLLACASSPIR